jgi:nucleotide-binding universal stress UspA family protein
MEYEMFKRIVVAVDGSHHARQAVLTAAAFAREMGATLTLLTVYHEPPGFVGEPQYSADLLPAMELARALLADEAAVVQAAGGPPVQKDLLGAGHPAAAILAAAASGQYDLLVMGTRGLGRLESVLLGSVSAQVAAGSAIPVLIVHEAE